MKAELITDSDLRARWSYRADDPITISADAVLTPCAQEFVRDHHIEIIRRPKYGAMSRSKIPMQNGKPVFVNLETGRECAEKPEEMTHLRGNLLVSKTHPRIAFRGQLDSLLAGGGAIGRKLDFLLQEMNREANTIGSKASDLQQAQTVVEIKAELEKIREQMQNIE